ncbi:MAG: EF-P lysine aminoacylase GenX [Magnetococcales bacterium]|nr:EF-P lysine aminoacylase GenX [Magnetococcales bacterium]
MTDPLHRPAADRDTLVARARILDAVRAFFRQRGVLEVETPQLARAVAPEPHIDPLPCRDGFLLSSPEPFLKRLLAAGSGPVFQLGKVFRAGEVGRLHNPEFTLLEWYRPGWSLAALMDEVAELVQAIAPRPPAAMMTYRELFRRHAGVDPFDAPLDRLAAAAPSPPPIGLDRDGLLDWLLVERIEPALMAAGGLLFVTAYPASRAAMACIDPGPPPVAQRFELYLDGVELANGYQELTDAAEQRRRLEQANAHRRAQGLAPLPIDGFFLEALAAGLPPCAGVALGVDRLVMAALGKGRLAEVLAFPWERT